MLSFRGSFCRKLHRFQSVFLINQCFCSAAKFACQQLSTGGNVDVTGYRKKKSMGIKLHNADFSNVLRFCNKKAHSDIAFEVYNDCVDSGLVPSESCFISLIRCVCDGDDVTAALALLKNASTLGVELKSRCYQPILDSLARTVDFERMVELIITMQNRGVGIKAEQLVSVMNTYTAVREQDLPFSISQRHVLRLNQLLLRCQKEFIGVSSADMASILSSYGNVMKMERLGTGVIGGVDTADSQDQQQVNFSQLLSANSENICNVDKHLTVQQSPNIALDFSSVLQHENAMMTERDSLSTTNHGHAHGQHLIVPPHVPNVPSGLVPQIVKISDNGVCPHCNGQLQSLRVACDDMNTIRSNLFKAAYQFSYQQGTHLQAFAAWLQQRSKNGDEDTYIIDAANVGYYNQQSDGQVGEFSWTQIGLLVDSLMAYDKARQLPAATIATHTLVNESEDNVGEGVMEHNPLKLNILVVVASPYIQKYMPNSIARRCTGKKVMTKQTAEDSAIVERLRQLGILYVSPPGAYDDWYWLLASVFEGRKSQACIITNDLLRDLRWVFPNSHAFYRWRSTQILHYHIYHPTDLETKTSSYVANRNSPSSGTDSSKYDGNLSSALGLVSNMEEYNIEQLMEGNVGCDDDIGNVSCVDKKEFDSANTHITRIHLWKPANFSREIQQVRRVSDGTGGAASLHPTHWHIPATESSDYLCYPITHHMSSVSST